MSANENTHDFEYIDDPDKSVYNKSIFKKYKCKICGVKLLDASAFYKANRLGNSYKTECIFYIDSITEQLIGHYISCNEYLMLNILK